uniref:Maturation n=1 Tax=Beihai levi-like virus 26 TaxID=1922412 RepID=A0A1L3KIF1_9VIRU|nr:hypothetical protein [Beihai levi-like virus 26]
MGKPLLIETRGPVARTNEVYETSYPGGIGYDTDWYSGRYPVALHRREAYEFSDGIRPTDYFTSRSSSCLREEYKYLFDYGSYFSRLRRISFDVQNLASNIYGSFPFSVSSWNSDTFTHRLDWNRIPVQKARNRLLSKIGDSGIDIGTMIAELGETVSYVSELAIDLVQFGMAIKSGRFNQAVRKLGVSKRRWQQFSKRPDASIASRWLEFNFAIVPLVSDIADVAALYDDPNKVLGAVHLKRTANQYFKESSEDSIFYYGAFRNGVKTKYWGKVRASCTYTVYDAELVAAQAMGLVNAPSALYNIVPFSWLLDYAVSIGDWLALLTATSGFQFAHGYESVKLYQTHDLNVVGRDLPPGNTSRVYEKTTLMGQVLYTAYQRKIIYSFPTPTVQFVLPDISLKQASYVAALISILTN